MSMDEKMLEVRKDKESLKRHLAEFEPMLALFEQMKRLNKMAEDEYLSVDEQTKITHAMCEIAQVISDEYYATLEDEKL